MKELVGLLLATPLVDGGAGNDELEDGAVTDAAARCLRPPTSVPWRIPWRPDAWSSSTSTDAADSWRLAP